MKILKFKNELVSLISSGEKDSTWRLFDDKNLQEGDEVILVNQGLMVLLWGWMIHLAFSNKDILNNMVNMSKKNDFMREMCINFIKEEWKV